MKVAPTYYRKVIHIGAEDSPNVRLARAEMEAGRDPSGTVLVPGVLQWQEYQNRLQNWDEVRRTIGLGGLFYEGAHLLLFPPHWLDHAHRVASDFRALRRQRQAQGIGIDPAEGGDKTALCAVDRFGIMDLESLKTPDTNEVHKVILAFLHKHNIGPEDDCVMIDPGGGGRQAAHRLRAMGWLIQSVPFGSAVQPPPKQGRTEIEEKVDDREVRYVYKNRRAFLYGEFSVALDPTNEYPYGIPPGYVELRRQLALFPKLYDNEGRLFLPPKRRADLDKEQKKEGIKSLEEMIGCSPDEADATVLAYYGMTHKREEVTEVGAFT